MGLAGINTTELGRGLYDLMTEEDKNLVAFGMIPKTVIDKCMNSIKEKLSEIASKQYDIPIEDCRKAIRKKALATMEKEICDGIYSRASELKQMVC